MPNETSSNYKNIFFIIGLLSLSPQVEWGWGANKDKIPRCWVCPRNKQNMETGVFSEAEDSWDGVSN